MCAGLWLRPNADSPLLLLRDFTVSLLRGHRVWGASAGGGNFGGPFLRLYYLTPAVTLARPTLLWPTSLKPKTLNHFILCRFQIDGVLIGRSDQRVYGRRAQPRGSTPLPILKQRRHTVEKDIETFENSLLGSVIALILTLGLIISYPIAVAVLKNFFFVLS